MFIFSHSLPLYTYSGVDLTWFNSGFIKPSLASSCINRSKANYIWDCACVFFRTLPDLNPFWLSVLSWLCDHTTVKMINNFISCDSGLILHLSQNTPKGERSCTVLQSEKQLLSCTSSFFQNHGKGKSSPCLHASFLMVLKPIQALFGSTNLVHDILWQHFCILHSGGEVEKHRLMF